MNQKILHLTLLRNWFIEILEGRKLEEYREIKPYWKIRLFNQDGSIKDYGIIIFKNGYARNAPEMRIEFKGVKEKIWKNKKVYAIQLGKIFEKKNCEKFIS